MSTEAECDELKNMKSSFKKKTLCIIYSMISKSMELWYIPIFKTKTKTEKDRKKIEINIVGEV